MKVRICYTINVDDEWRRALNRYHGEPGLASRENIKQHYRMYGSIADDDIRSEVDSMDEDDS